MRDHQMWWSEQNVDRRERLSALQSIAEASCRRHKVEQVSTTEKVFGITRTCEISGFEKVTKRAGSNYQSGRDAFMHFENSDIWHL